LAATSFFLISSTASLTTLTRYKLYQFLLTPRPNTSS
jgi:hypothetical protein